MHQTPFGTTCIGLVLLAAVGLVWGCQSTPAAPLSPPSDYRLVLEPRAVATAGNYELTVLLNQPGGDSPTEVIVSADMGEAVWINRRLVDGSLVRVDTSLLFVDRQPFIDARIQVTAPDHRPWESRHLVPVEPNPGLAASRE